MLTMFTNAIFLLLSSVCACQEIADESLLHLSCFSEGEYESFTHLYCDVEKIKKKGHPILTDILRRELRKHVNLAPLPLSMKKKILSMTYGTQANYAIVDDSNAEDIYKEISKNLKPERRIPSSVYIQRNDGEQIKIKFAILTEDLWVFTLNDAERALKASLKNGEISQTEKKLYELPVYSFTSKDDRQYFLCVSPADVVLVAQKLPLLTDMLEASMGQGNNIVETKSCEELLKYQPEFELAWFSLSGARRFHNFRLQIAKDNGASDSQVDRMTELVNRMPISQIRYIKLEDRLFERTISIYADENAAKAENEKLDKMYRKNLDNMERMKTSEDASKQLGAIHMLQRIKRTTSKTDGTHLIQTKYLDEKIVKSLEAGKEAGKKKEDRN